MTLRIADERPRSPVHVVWGMLAIAAIAAAYIFRDMLAALPPCPFLRLTGLPCPTCGGSRCLMECSQYHIFNALAWNPLIFLSVVALIVFSLSALVGFLIHKRIVWGINRHEAIAIRCIALAIFAGNWVFIILHLAQ